MYPTSPSRRAVCCSIFSTIALLLCGFLFGFPVLVRADDFVVYSPYIIEAQNEAELRGYSYADARPGLGGNAFEFSVARGVTRWWKPEFYLVERLQTPGTGSHRQGYEFENTFQLTPTGKYWADVGFLAAYERNTAAGIPDAFEFGPLIEKTSGRFAHIANLIWERQVGTGAAKNYQLRYSYSATYAAAPALRPGLEFYGRPADHSYQAGPIVTGEWHMPGTTSNVEYRVGVVLGINSDAPRQTWLARLEYEFL